MNRDFDVLRAGRPGCPSELALDRYRARELGADETRTIEEHVAGCATCRGRLDERALGFAAFPALDAERALARIEAARPAATRTRPRRGWLAPVAALAVAAAVLLMVRPSPDPADGTAATRVKGALALRVYRLRDGKSEELTSGAHLAAGERLRFRVSTPREGYVTILGVESTGATYTAWPLTGDTGARKLPASDGLLLDDSVALDASTGREMLWLVHCPRAEQPAQCRATSAPASAGCPAGCASVSFTMEKAP